MLTRRQLRRIIREQIETMGSDQAGNARWNRFTLESADDAAAARLIAATSNVMPGLEVGGLENEMMQTWVTTEQSAGNKYFSVIPDDTSPHGILVSSQTKFNNQQLD